MYRGVCQMKEYRLPQNLNEGIVDGIIEGYRDYDLKSVLAQTIAAEGVLDATEFGIVLDDVEEQENRVFIEKRCLLVYW